MNRREIEEAEAAVLALEVQLRLARERLRELRLAAGRRPGDGSDQLTLFGGESAPVTPSMF